MATSPEVKIKISGDPTGADAAVKLVQSALKRLGGDLTVIQQLSAKALAFTGIGGAASVAGLVSLVKATANFADELGKLAQASGVAVKELSGLGYAASLGGSNVDELAKGLRRLALESESGGATLKALGIGLVDASGQAKSSTTLFSDLAQRFSQLPDGAQKTALAVKLFGEEVGPKLIPTLNQGAAGLKALQDEAEKLGLTLTDQAVKAAEEFNDNMSRLQGQLRGVGIEIGNALIPAISKLANEFLDARTAGLTWYESLLGIGLSNPLKSAADQVKSLTKEIEDLQKAQREAAGVGSTFGGLLTPNYDQEIAKLEKLRTYYQLQDKRARAEDETDQERSAAKRLQIEAKLQIELAKLTDLRKKTSQTAMAEELKGAERLRDALRSAWQASIDGAATAAAEAKKLLEQGQKDRTEGNDKADARLRKDSNEPQYVKDQNAFLQADSLRSEANTKAQESIIQAYQGRIKEAQKLAEDAIELANRAEGFADEISNPQQAAQLLRQLGEIKADARKGQSVVKSKEAAQGEETAAAQQKELTKVEDQIKTLKEKLEEPFKLNADISEAEKQIKALQTQLDEIKDKTVTVTVNQVAGAGADAAVAPASAPAAGFAAGGYTGPGGKFKPAGIVHAGEFVLRQEVVRQAGMRRMLERLNRYGADALEGYADGGFVRDRSAAPTPINLQWPDGTVSKLSASRDEADGVLRLFRSAALKSGGRR